MVCEETRPVAIRCAGEAEAVAVPCLEGARLGSRPLLVCRSVSQSTHAHPAEAPCALGWALGKRKRTRAGLTVWESHVERTRPVEKLWKPEPSVSPNWGIWEGFPEVADDDWSKSRLYQGRGREWAGRCGREQGRQSRTWLVPLGGGRGLPGEAWGPGSPKGQAEGLVCQDLRGLGRAS